jgi:hypothetical protein
MPFYDRGPVRIHYQEVGLASCCSYRAAGSIPPSHLADRLPFNPMERYKDDFRCVCADLRNANLGQSSGPLD